MSLAEMFARLAAADTPAPTPAPAPGPTPAAPAARTAFLVVDTESVPDGRLLAAVKYPGENLSPEQAIEKARDEARETNWGGSDFLPVTFQIPVGVCVLRVVSVLRRLMLFRRVNHCVHNYG